MSGEYIKYCSGLTEEPEIVKSLKNNVVKKIVRVHHSSTLDELVGINGIKKNNIFNIIPGTVLFFLENDDAIGFNIDENKFSIVSWYVIHDGVKYSTEHYIQGLDFSYMLHNDPLYSNSGEWDHIVGHKIKKISIVDYNDGRHRRDFKDSFQRAIVFETIKGDFVLSYLPGRGEAFPIIKKSKIPKKILNNSKIIEL